MRSSSISSVAGHSTWGRASHRLIAAIATTSVLGACATPARTNTVSVEPASADRVVDIGYGEMSARLAPGSVSSLGADEIRSRNLRSVVDLFETIPGATVDRSRGGATLRLRNVAANQSAANTEPLIIIDGVPMSRYDRNNGLAALNRLDIERIDVLRDAAAAMYGVRGGRGVVLIKTKRGR
jgi:TonB-dependent SusC/RagA subfamily outer membrane receptor